MGCKVFFCTEQMVHYKQRAPHKYPWAAYSPLCPYLFCGYFPRQKSAVSDNTTVMYYVVSEQMEMQVHRDCAQKLLQSRLWPSRRVIHVAGDLNSMADRLSGAHLWMVCLEQVPSPGLWAMWDSPSGSICQKALNFCSLEGSNATSLVDTFQILWIGSLFYASFYSLILAEFWEN